MAHVRFGGMTLPVTHLAPASEVNARRAAKAYRMAERLGRPQRSVSEWRQLCRADRTRRSLYGFEDVFDDDTEPHAADERPVMPESDRVRSAYFLGAVAAGTLCLLLGAFLIS